MTNRVYAKDKRYNVYKYNKLIFQGSWKEVLDFLNISESTMRYYLSDSYKHRVKDSSKRIKILDQLIRWE